MTVAKDYYGIVYANVPAPANSASQAIPELIDANGDGIMDILLFGAYYPFLGNNPVGQPAMLMLGKGDGTYSASTSLLPAGFTTMHPRETVQADFNKDGRPDLFIADHGYDVSPFPGAQNRLLLSAPGGGFVDASANLPQAADFSHSATAADINGDGNLDIFVGNMANNASPVEAYFLLGDGTGKFVQSASGLPVGSGQLLNRQGINFGFTASLLTDLNGDGKPDLVLGNEGSTHLKEHRSIVMFNTGAGFSAASMAYLPNGYFGDTTIVHDIASFDIDGDGDNDLLMLTSESTPADAYADGWALDVLRNDGGKFAEATLNHFAADDRHAGLPKENSKIGAGQFIRMMDVNGDGAKDIVISQFINNPPSASTPIVWTNDGFGHYTVALRAGEMASLINDPYFFGAFNLPTMTANGVSFTTLGVNAGTVYQTTAWASKPLPGPVSIVATGANDVIGQNSSNNLIDGGAGLDIVVYKKSAAGYTLGKTDGRHTIKDNSGADGTDTVVNVERVTFSDTAFAFDIAGNAGQAYRLYRAAFNRESDLDGLGYWIKALDSGLSLQTVSSGFVNSAEFKGLYGASATNSTILTAFYNNVLHRDPDQAGFDFWLGALEKGLTVTQMLIEFSESSENQVQVIGKIGNGIEYHVYA